ncbi:hypothetical protein LPJ61_004662 [Coemansia biformis]|uniref:Uncharacterized protein n=1 Tax=Coemansia biformis TaxID=1286918 RepID=A0A9W8CXD3_9FUNG|nr:hypothetical protein LPJ61_004662 [Coemansia biformis]
MVSVNVTLRTGERYGEGTADFMIDIANGDSEGAIMTKITDVMGTRVNSFAYNCHIYGPVFDWEFEGSTVAFELCKDGFNFNNVNTHFSNRIPPIVVTLVGERTLRD